MVKAHRTTFFAFWICAWETAGGGVIDRERLRLGRLRFPLGVRLSPVISTSESEEEGSCERIRLRSLRFCHSGTLVFFSRFVRLFLFRL